MRHVRRGRSLIRNLSTTISKGNQWIVFSVSTALCLAFSAGVIAQPAYTWTELTDAPYVNRYNDLYFVSPSTGWIVHGDGEIYRTTDGGQSWTMQYRNLNAHFRSVAFLNDQHGFAGNVGPGEFGAVETTPIFETTNGGQIWLPATGFGSNPPTGICGMQAVNDSTIVAVGRVRGPATFVRTTGFGSVLDDDGHVRVCRRSNRRLFYSPGQRSRSRPVKRTAFGIERGDLEDDRRGLLMGKDFHIVAHWRVGLGR